MTPDGTLEISDQLVDYVITNLLKVTQDSGSEEDLGVPDPVAVLVDGGTQDELGDLLVVLGVQLKKK